MLRKIKFYGALFALTLFSQTSGVQAQFDNDSWLDNAFVTSLPSKVKNGKAVTENKGQSITS